MLSRYYENRDSYQIKKLLDEHDAKIKNRSPAE